MEHPKSFFIEIANCVADSIKANRKKLDGVVDDIFNRHDDDAIKAQHPSSPIVYVDEIANSVFTVDALSYDKQTKILYIECSDGNNNTEITSRSIDIEFYAGLVWWIATNEDALFAGEFDVAKDYSEMDDDDDLPF